MVNPGEMTLPASQRSIEWPLASSATLGSATRMKGLERELRRRLPLAFRNDVAVEAGRVLLCMPEAEPGELTAASEQVGEALAKVADLPVLPREVEDILSISSRERHKWLKDGRLKSMGTRTIKLRGRSKAVTFHVFDPRHIEDVLDGDLPVLWRDEDAQAVVETRRRAAAKAALTRAGKGKRKTGGRSSEPDVHASLEGWDAFDAEGLLR
ncbi:hypothetical protein B5U98_27335 [Bosea sp. Tri-39]|nr:hypothetical protein BLM15_30015 [Bosea sp. Tri-49]RXT16645.1 hypothetical protein B5U98_27335 [Bosea sp. Tri-39]RXT42434.1 hypothetical protein B5U99_00585 [Bosea sp. Tri-54]